MYLKVITPFGFLNYIYFLPETRSNFHGHEVFEVGVDFWVESVNSFETRVDAGDGGRNDTPRWHVEQINVHRNLVNRHLGHWNKFEQYLCELKSV